MATANELSPNTAPTDGVGGNHQGRLAHLPEQFVPREITAAIFDKAQESSLVLRKGRQIPVTYGETVIPVNMNRPQVGQVGTGTTNELREGATKPVSGVSWGYKTLSPIKLATIVTVSEEFARMNVNGLYTQIQNDLAYAIGRGIDEAVFHGKRPDTGGALAGIDTANVLANTTNSVALTTTGLVDGLLDGYELVAAGADFEFDGWAADPRYRAKLLRAMTQLDTNGNVANPAALNMAGETGSLLGFPVDFGRAVGGDLGAATDSGIRLVGGDWGQLAYGFADEVRVKVSDQTVVNGVSMWQTNQIALLVEVTFGWIVGDLDAFVKYTHVAGS